MKSKMSRVGLVDFGGRGARRPQNARSNFDYVLYLYVRTISNSARDNTSNSAFSGANTADPLQYSVHPIGLPSKLKAQFPCFDVIRSR
jgi:hypothetical protein